MQNPFFNFSQNNPIIIAQGFWPSTSTQRSSPWLTPLSLPYSWTRCRTSDLSFSSSRDRPAAVHLPLSINCDRCFGIRRDNIFLFQVDEQNESHAEQQLGFPKCISVESCSSPTAPFDIDFLLGWLCRCDKSLCSNLSRKSTMKLVGWLHGPKGSWISGIVRVAWMCVTWLAVLTKAEKKSKPFASNSTRSASSRTKTLERAKLMLCDSPLLRMPLVNRP